MTIVLLLLATAGCSGGTAHSTSTPTYNLPPRPVRDEEKPLPYHPVKDGLITFAAIGLRTGMLDIVGSHADQPPKGQFVRIRVLAVNGYPNFHTIEPSKQTLITTDGKTYAPDINGMRIERQPDSFQLGARDQLEFDLLYDIPRQSKVKALHLYGAPSSDLGVTLPDDSGVEAPLT